MVIPDYQWKPCEPTLRTTIYTRSMDSYNKLLDQFCVETALRYQPGDGKTWCNIFVRDVLDAADVVLPKIFQDKELTANLLALWLRQFGTENGWRLCSFIGAIQQANVGKPTIAIWHNPEGHGHVAMIRPSGLEMRIAQAGAHNYENTPIVHGFGSGKTIEYWSHP